MVTFKDKKNQQLIVEKKIVDDTVVLKDCTNCIIEQLDISHNGSNKNKTSDLKMVQLVDCRDCKIIDSKLHGKETLGVILNIVGSKTSGNIVERCKFFDLTFSGENGGEPIRLGTSQHGNIDMHNTVRNCDFIKLRTKEPEAISIKSVNNLIEKNRMQDCTCSFVVRHGFGNTIQDNIFEGEGGIRVYGKDNKILRNHHKNNVSSKFPPLSLVNGNKEEEDLSAQYTQVRNNIVEGNIYEECKYAVIWGRDDTKKKKPEGVKFIKNKVIAEREPCTVIKFSGGATPEGPNKNNPNKFSDNELLGNKAKIDSRIQSGFTKGSGVVISTDEDEDEEESEAAPVVIPQQPEPDPSTQPTPENEAYVRLCQLCGKEEARRKLVIYVCSPHAEIARPDMQRLLAGLKAKVGREISIEEEVITTG